MAFACENTVCWPTKGPQGTTHQYIHNEDHHKVNFPSQGQLTQTKLSLYTFISAISLITRWHRPGTKGCRGPIVKHMSEQATYTTKNAVRAWLPFKVIYVGTLKVILNRLDGLMGHNISIILSWHRVGRHRDNIVRIYSFKDRHYIIVQFFQ